MLSPGVPGQGMNPFVIERGDSEELLQRIGSLRRLIEVMVGERSRARSEGPPWTTPWRATTTNPASAPASGTSTPTCKETRREAEIWRSCCGPSPRAACVTCSPTRATTCCSNEALITVFDLRLLEPELRPAAAMVCTETVWAAAAQDPKPRLLVVDEVWSIMQHPEGAAFMVSMAKRARKHRLGLQFITQDVQDLLSEDTSRAITGHSGKSPIAERRLQAAACSRTPPPSARWATPSTFPRTFNAGCCPAPGGTACC